MADSLQFNPNVPLFNPGLVYPDSDFRRIQESSGTDIETPIMTGTAQDVSIEFSVTQRAGHVRASIGNSKEFIGGLTDKQNCYPSGKHHL